MIININKAQRAVIAVFLINKIRPSMVFAPWYIFPQQKFMMILNISMFTMELCQRTSGMTA